jgi:hypothetical protein
MKKQENEIPTGYIRVTEVLTPFSTLTEIDPQTLANAADRGTRVHSYCEAHALGLFVADVDDDCKNYFEAFKKWFDNTVVDVLCVERRLNLPTLKLSGAVDMVVLLKGDDELSLIDIKTPQSASISWQLQTAAYQLLAKEVADIHASRRICLMLPKYSDAAKVVEYENHDRDQDLYLKALELYRFFRK